MALVNLTPHNVTIVMDGKDPIAIPASGTVARLVASTATVGELDGVPITTTVFGDTTDLPDPVEGVGYIVSMLVAQANRKRMDLFIPNELVRDSEGVIIGCKSLGRV